MIIEGIITTEDAHGRMHVAPIGPHIDRMFRSWALKPFKTSTTFANLFRSNRGIFHIVDDGLLLVQSVLGHCNKPGQEPPAQLHAGIGWVLTDACRAFPLQISQWETSEDRAQAVCCPGPSIELRAFWGWNRASHSLVELSVLWSRRHLISLEELDKEFQRHRVIIEKTAGDRELAALTLLDDALKDFSDRAKATRS